MSFGECTARVKLEVTDFDVRLLLVKMTLKQGVKIHTVAITCYNFAYVAVRMLKAIRFY